MVTNELIHFEYVSAFITLFLLAMYRGKNKTSLHIYRVYYWMLTITCLSSVLDIILSDFYSKLVQTSDVLFLSLMTGIYYCCVMSLGTIFSIYVLCYVGIEYYDYKRWKILLFVPYCIEAILIMSSQATGFIYRVDQTCRLVNGPYFGAVYGFFGYYLLLMLVAMIRHVSKYERKKLFYLYFFELFTLVMVVIGRVVFGEVLITFPIALCLIVIIISIKNPNEVFDKTNAFKFDNFTRSIKNDFDMKKSFTVYVIRIKNIDIFIDSYGEDKVTEFFRSVVYTLSHMKKGVTVYRLNKKTFMMKCYFGKNENEKDFSDSLINKFTDKWKTPNIEAKIPGTIFKIECPSDIGDKDKLISTINNVIRMKADIDKVYSYVDICKGDNETAIINAVKKAVEEKTFKVYYQPIFSADKKHIVAAEALVRLIDKDLGFISPEVFIPLAEKEGCIVQIGKFVFNEVCKFYSENNLEKKGIEYIEVNLSAVQCMQYLMAEEFCEIMERWDIRHDQINFEITETFAMTKNAAVGMNLDYFNEKGIELSLDDYGTGYSNLSYMYTLPFTIVKIDKSILWAADNNEKADVVLKNIFKMTKKMGMKIVVEGIETEAHVTKLLNMKCDYFQGYFFSKPIPGDQFLEYICNFELPGVCKGAL